MNENNSKRFIWLFVGLFIILFAFAGFNTISGNVDNKTTVSMDEMIKAIVKSDAIPSDYPIEIPDESEVPLEFINIFRLEKERVHSQKLVSSYLYVYNPNTNISSLYYIVDNSPLLLYTSKEGIQYSEESFAPFRKEVELHYSKTL
ncbi:MAG TPA: hypothetical protein PKK61_05360 [Defluviitaleaceae bacterium]|nr:hypothetical protein [Candidatus Epulonipiscium sp.]HOA80476.1 hypothetical protein [Defluviitaleaceae bacterium]